MIPKEGETVSPKRRLVRLSGDLATQLDAVKEQYHLPTRTKALRLLLDQFEASQKTTPSATFQEIMRRQRDSPDSMPVAIMGPPGSGKSYTLAAFIEECLKQGSSFILFDIIGEHPEVPKAINYYDFMGFRFTGHAQFRVVFPKDAALRRTAMKQIVDAIERGIAEDRLQDYILAFEEAYEFSDSPTFLKFISKIRKWARLTVIVSTDPRPFAPFCAVLRPLPRAVQ